LFYFSTTSSSIDGKACPGSCLSRRNYGLKAPRRLWDECPWLAGLWLRYVVGHENACGVNQHQPALFKEPQEVVQAKTIGQSTKHQVFSTLFAPTFAFGP